MNDKKIYLDYAATTPLDARVLEAMLPYFTQHFGNPSSIHTYGQKAEAAVEEARELTAQVLNCQPREVVFTSCGSESDNLALKGAAFSLHEQKGAKHILISPTEHHAVSRTAEQLKRLHGFDVEYLPVDQHGRVDPLAVQECIRPDTAIVSIIYGNNEIGTINPIAEIGEICRERRVLFHTDAVQAAAYLPVDVNELNVDMLSIGAHKFYGPKGVGVLYVRKGTPLLPTQTGGGQEFGLRAGTSNVPYIVGLSKALQLVDSERNQRQNHVQTLRDHLVAGILEAVPDARLTGHPRQRMPNHASFVFKGVDGNALLMMLDVEGFACSSGSACKTGDPEPSEVLIVLGIAPEWALGSLRVTLGSHTSIEDIKAFLDILPAVIERDRELVRAR